MPIHTDKKYEEDLEGLKVEILKMGARVEEMVARSMQVLTERNSQLAQTVMQMDPEVNQLEMAIDERCTELLALHQPAASDLRFIAIGFRVSKDLERIGDLAVNICEQGLDLNREPHLKAAVDLPNLAAKAQQMVHQTLDAFVRKDVDLAQQVCGLDDEVDEQNDRVFQELVAMMQQDSQTVSRGVRLILVARHLERIADHATNLAEEVIFMAQGKDIRHGH